MSRFRSLLLLGALAGTAACDLERPATVTAPSDSPDAAAALSRADASDPTPTSLSLEKIGGFAGGGAGAAEITAFDEVSKRLFVVNGARGTIDVLDLRNPAAPRRIGTISTATLGGSANSVATSNGIVAVAVEANVRTDNGRVAFYRATTLQLISSVTVGALPDMLTFTSDGRHLLVANEGEPSADYLVDPEGSVSIVDVSNINLPTVRTATFTHYNGREAELRARGVRIFGPGASAAQDFEPEYITISADDRTAWVALQENNAFAVVDVPSARVTDILPLGYKNHALPGNELDASDRDGPGNTGRINIRNWPVFGMYQPDGLSSYRVGERTYLVTANEGDARDYPPAYSEEARAGSLVLNPAIFSPEVCGGPCAANSNLGRLTVTKTMGFNQATGQYDALYAFGARSFSIWSDRGELVWDSGSELERRTSNLPMVNFNAGHQNNSLDDRSDNKGPEPEDVAIGRLGERTFAFVGLERVGGVMVYDISSPTSPFFVTYVNTRLGMGGDRGAEGVTFVPARRSPNKKPLLIVGHEVSGTTAIFQLNIR